MRIVLAGKSHAFSTVPFGLIAREHQIVGMVESGPRGGIGVKQRIRTGIGRVRALFNKRSLHSWARRARIPYFWLDMRTRPHLDAFLRSCAPDIVVVASLSFLLSPETLQIPRHGAINLHPSLLPKYHGPFPWLWQYLADEREIGVTVHQLDAGQDTGPILKQQGMALRRGMDIIEAQSMVAERGGQLLCQALDEIERGAARAIPQQTSAYPKARIVRRDEALIDWAHWPIERVWHALRGCYPWIDPPNCPRSLRNGRYRVGEIESGVAPSPYGNVMKDDRGYFVPHPEGKIRLIRADETLGR